MKRKIKLISSIILCFSLVFCYNFVSLADGESATVDNSSSLIAAFNLPEEYSSSYPYMSRNILKGYAQSNGLPYDVQEGYLSGLFYETNDIQRNNYFSYLRSFNVFYTEANTTIDISNLPYAVLSSVGGYNYAIYMRFSGEGKISIVNNYFVSESPFVIYAYNSPSNSFSIVSENELYRFRTFDVNTPDDNGLYKITTLSNNNFYTNSPIVFANIPIYLSTTSGDSGFTSSSIADISDFSFSEENINYNFLLYDDIVFDPQAPEVPPTNNMWEESKNYLNFRMTSYFMWDDSTKKFYHNMSFNWNENMLLNPDYYYLNCYYYITYKDSSMPSVVTYQYSPIVQRLIDLAYARNKNIGIVPSKLPLGLFPDEFYDTSENSWLSSYLATIHRVVGTNTNLINVNDYWDRGAASIDEFGDYLFSGGRKLSYVTPIIGDTIEEFKIHCIINVGRSADPSGASGQQDYISGSYTATHDCLTAKTTVTSTDNQNNLYPPEEGQDPSVIDKTNNGSSGNTTIGNNAQGGNATVNIYNDPMSMWSPNVIKSIKDTFDFIQNQLSEYNDNNFMGFMVESYKIIPQAFWDMIILAGGVITGFAVIRFIRNK